MSEPARRARVLVLTTSYPAGPGDPSGHFVEAHARELARGGADVLVLAPGPHAPAPGAPPVRSLPGRGAFGWPGVAERLRSEPWRAALLAPFALAAARAIRSAGPRDRLVAHWLLPSAWPLAFASEAPLEAWAHGADVRLLRSLPGPVRSRIVAAIADRCERVVFVSAALRRLLGDALDPRTARSLERVSLVRPAPIHVPRRADLPPLRASDRLGSDRPYAVWAGRLIASKRVDVAADVAARAGLALVVIGRGPVPAPPGVLHLGQLPRDETLAWIAGATALLSTSRDEGAPTVVREARALGVPVVAEPSGDLEAWARADPGIAIARGALALGEALQAIAARAGAPRVSD